MITLFAIPKPFRGHIAVIQRNAVRSWALLDSRPEVILFGDEEGTAETCREFGLRHIPEIEQNECGTPLLHDVFRKAAEHATQSILCYVNADILLLSEFSQAVARVCEWSRQFLMVGRRCDVDMTKPIDFSASNWEQRLRALAKAQGRLRPYGWMDYFVFTRGLFREVPPFTVGYAYWDNWVMWKGRSMNIPMVDVSKAVRVIHQNHDYSHHPNSQRTWEGDRALRNVELAGGWDHLGSMGDCQFVLSRDKIRPTHRWVLVLSKRAIERKTRPIRRFIYSRLWSPVWFAFLTRTRPARQAMGLRQKNIATWRARFRFVTGRAWRRE
jgi:hypothetical protein